MFIKKIALPKNNLLKSLVFFSVLLLTAFLLYKATSNVRAQSCWSSASCGSGSGQQDYCGCSGCHAGNTCPAACGEVDSGYFCSRGGTCGPRSAGCGCYDAYGVCLPSCVTPAACQGRWCNCWQYCCTVCNPGDCSGSTPTPTPGGSTTAPTNTPPPPVTNTPGNSVPQCSVTGPSNLTVGGAAGSYIFNATDTDSNMISVEGWWSSTSTQFWTNIFNNSFAATGSYSTTQNWSCPGAGDYYVTCNAYDNQGGQCTGNPFGIPAGWGSCGPNSTKTVNCAAAPTTVPPDCAAPVLTCTSSCTSGPLNYNCSWNTPAGANQYRFQLDDSSNFTLPVTVDGITGSNSTSGSLTSGTYYAHVRVEGSNGSCKPTSPYSNVVSLSCGTPPTVPPTSPPSPPPACTITSAVILPDNTYANVGDIVTFGLSVVDSPAGCAQDAFFVKNNTNTSFLSTNPDTSEPFLMDVQCDVAGSTDITGQARYGGVALASDTTTIFCGVPTVPPTIPPTIAPLPPVTLSGASNCVGIPDPEVSLSWTSSAGATNYRVYKCTGASCTPTTEIATVIGTSFVDVNVLDGTTYRYRVRAYRSSDDTFSAYSNTVTVTPTCPSCNISMVGPAQISLLDTKLYSVSNNTPPVGTITQVNFTSADASIISICNSTTVPCPAGQAAYTDSAAAYNMNATGYSLNANTDLRAGVIMENYERCFAALNVGVINPSPWWQDKEGDLVTNGDIFTEIPGGCVVDPTCNESLIVYDSGEFPGVPQAGGSIGAGSSGGVISQGFNWNSLPLSYTGPILSYLYFRDKLPSSVTPQAIAVNPINQAYLSAGGTEYPAGSGYYFYEYTGAPELVITDGDGTLDLGGRKVIVFAQSNVRIQSKILVQNGSGSFTLISSGNISIEPTVAGPMEATPVPDLEGVYFAQGQILTGSLGAGNDIPLHVRGSVVAWDRIVLQRDLADNSLTPGEFFEFGADQLMLLSPAFGERNVFWRESAP